MAAQMSGSAWSRVMERSNMGGPKGGKKGGLNVTFYRDPDALQHMQARIQCIGASHRGVGQHMPLQSRSDLLTREAPGHVEFGHVERMHREDIAVHQRIVPGW